MCRLNKDERTYYREIVKKIHAGDPLDNSELEDAIDFYDNLASILAVMGTEYRLAYVPVISTYEMLKSFHEARKQ